MCRKQEPSNRDTKNSSVIPYKRTGSDGELRFEGEPVVEESCAALFLRPIQQTIALQMANKTKDIPASHRIT